MASLTWHYHHGSVRLLEGRPGRIARPPPQLLPSRLPGPSASTQLFNIRIPQGPSGPHPHPTYTLTLIRPVYQTCPPDLSQAPQTPWSQRRISVTLGCSPRVSARVTTLPSPICRGQRLEGHPGRPRSFLPVHVSSSHIPHISQQGRRPPQPCSPQDDADTQERPEGQASSGHQEGGQWHWRRVLH